MPLYDAHSLKKVGRTERNAVPVSAADFCDHPIAGAASLWLLDASLLY
ncbi:MAG: hypothetical protein ABGZ23_22130 [Fuerstiella sp.]